MTDDTTTRQFPASVVRRVVVLSKAAPWREWYGWLRNQALWCKLIGAMDIPRALTQIAEIHEQIAKGEVYRGYRSLPVAASGLIGIAAAWLQAPGLGWSDPVGFVIYWTATAACAAAVGASEIVFNYVVHDDPAARRQTRRVVGQFAPSMLGGVLITASFVHLSAALVPLLPGLWAICFGLGTFASRPYLPRASGLVALFYYAAGVALLWIARGPVPLGPWWVGGTFGAGQLLAALVLYWNLERIETRDSGLGGSR